VNEEPTPTGSADGGGGSRVWRRVRRICYLAAAVVVLVPLAAFGVTYAAVATPDPKASPRRSRP
jgi:hypothetical protein